MKPITRKILCIAMILAITLPAASATTVDDLLSYDDAIKHLGSISLTDTEELDLIYRSFDAIGSRYFTPQYLYLTQALLDLSGGEDVDFDKIEIALTILKCNNVFIESYTADENLAYLPLDSLLTYVQARKLEAEGALEEAYQTYVSCQVLDSIDRAIAVQLSMSEAPAHEPNEGVAAITELQDQFDAYKAEAEAGLSALQDEYNAYIGSMEATLADANNEAKSELDAMQGRILFVQGQLTLSEKKLTKSEGDLTVANTTLIELQATVEELRDSLTTAEEAAVLYGAEIEADNARIADLETQLADAQAALADSVASLTDCQAELTNAQSQTQVAQAEMNVQRGILLFTEGKLSLTETKFELSQAKLAECEAALSEALAIIDELNQLIDELQSN